MLRRTTFAAVATLLATALPAQRADFELLSLGYQTADYPDGHRAFGFGQADMDGDGWPDLVVSHWYANPTLSVLFNDRQGYFDRRTDYRLPLGARDLTIADFDGDGDPDVAVTDTGQYWEGVSFTVWFNQGDGTLVPGLPSACGKGPNRIDAADVDNDGDIDVAVAHDDYIIYAYSAALMLNNGDGTFGPPTTFSTRTGYSNDVALADISGNGLPDLIVSQGGSGLGVFQNLGTGFGTLVSYSTLSNGSLNQLPRVRVADVDRDGDRDVLLSATELQSNGTAAIALLLNDGNGNLGVPVVLPLQTTVGAVDIVPADLDGDGWLDLLTANLLRDWGVLRNDGSGGFLPHEPYRATEEPYAALAVDVDRDGDLDPVILGQDSLSVAVYDSDGSGRFARPQPVEMVSGQKAPASFGTLATGDVDGDGDLDALSSYNENFGTTAGLRLALNRGDGTFAPPVEYATQGLADVVRLRDLDNDGWLDIVVRDYGGPAFRRNQGNGTFGPAVRVRGFGCSAGFGTTAPVDAFDLDGDGDLDLVQACSGNIEISLDLGEGFSSVRRHKIGSTVSALAAGDVNGDGVLDLLTNSGVQGYVEVSLGKGDGTFVQAYTVQAGFAVAAIAVADVDGDGIADLVTGDVNGGHTMSVMIGYGNGTFQPPDSYQAGYSALSQNVHQIVVADIDYDGDLDVLLPNSASQDVSMFRNRGNGKFDPQLRGGLGLPAWDAAYGDFDGDGVGDLLALVEISNRWYYPGVALYRGTAADAWTDLGLALAGAGGAPALGGYGPAGKTAPLVLRVTAARPATPGIWIVSTARLDARLLGGTLIPVPQITLPFSTDARGEASLRWSPGALLPRGLTLYAQSWFADPTGPAGFTATNGRRLQVP